MSTVEPKPPRPTATPKAHTADVGVRVPWSWTWAHRPQLRYTVETEPLEYHRLLRGTTGYRWWKPLALLLVAGVFFGVLTVVVSMAFIPVLSLLDPDYSMQVAAGTVNALDTQRPISVLVSLVSIIVMLPAVILAMLVMGMRPVGRIWSIAGRLRWGLLGQLFCIAVLSTTVMNFVGIAADLAFGPASWTEQPTAASELNVTAALLSLLIVLLLVPLQSAAEEIVFRGLFMQVLGAWIKNPWFAILIPSVGFALLHIYDVWGLQAVALLGIVSAWLTWRTGGLEAAIAIHVVNNYIAFGIMASGITGETAQTSGDGSPGGVIGQAVGLALFAWLTLHVFKRDRHK